MRPVAAAVLLALTAPVTAQEASERQGLEAVLRRLETLSYAARRQVAPLPEALEVPVPCGASIQDAYHRVEVLDGAPPPTLLLEPSASCPEYVESPILGPRDRTNPSHRITVTTRGWADKGVGWDGLVTPADLPRMAVIRGAAALGAVIHIDNGFNAGNVRFVGIAVRACPPAGTCDLVRIGTDTETVPDNQAGHVELRQMLLLGDPEFGTRRGIRVEGHHIDIAQIWCQEVWNPRTETQCVSSNRGGRFVTVRHSYLQAGTENIILGGDPIPHAGLMPHDWLIEDVILHKPLRWQLDGRNRQVKNLLEFKFGRRITVRRVLAVNNWRAAQDGRGLLINYTPNGVCGGCEGLSDILIEDFVMLNSEGGVNFQGYTHDERYRNVGKLERVTLRNAYFVLGAGRPISVSNVLNRHDITIERTTIVHRFTKFIEGDFGNVWVGTPQNPTRVPGGPIQGFWFVDNVITRAGTFQITAPACAHRAEGFAVQRPATGTDPPCGPFVSADVQVSGNIIGGLPPATLARLNAVRGNGPENVVAVEAEMLARLAPAVPACGEWEFGKGADCSRLDAVFAMRRYLPEP